MMTVPTAASFVFGGDASKMRAFRGKIAGARILTQALTSSEFLIAAPRPDSGFILLLKEGLITANSSPVPAAAF